MFLIPIDVECHAGYKGEETPRAFEWAGRRIEVDEVTDRWHQGEMEPTRLTSDYFRVRCDDGGEHLLKHDYESGQWFLVEGVPGGS